MTPDHLDWPFFEPRHRELAAQVEAWAEQHADYQAMKESTTHSSTASWLASRLEPDRQPPPAVFDLDGTCRALVASLGMHGLLQTAVPESNQHDVRSLCIMRETLARHAGLADFAFAMQGLGTGAITLFGTEQQRQILPEVRAGKALAAFALSEAEAGSDVAALKTTATKDGQNYVIDGEKTWISNGGIAHHYTLIARTGEAPGTKGLSAFLVPADAPGLTIANRIDVAAPHPLATIRFEASRIPSSALIGEPGQGFRIAMSVLDTFRPTVGAAALGFARRALAETLTHTRQRTLFGAPLSDMPVTQAALADMATDIDAAALLVYRAAWAKDAGSPRITREASMAKLYATEAAHRVVDRATQLHGGHGVTVNHIMERLTREVRALRIYEGATEVQRVIIARQLLGARN